MRYSKRLKAIEASQRVSPPRDFDSPEDRAWRADFLNRNFRDGSLCSIEHISARDQAEWAARMKDYPLTDYIYSINLVDQMF